MGQPQRITRRAQTGFGQAIGLTLLRGGKAISRALGNVEAAPALQFAGEFRVQHLAADGTVKGESVFKNGVTNEGLARILNTMFDGITQIAAGSWYIGLISSISFVALAAGDDYDEINGTNDWTEAGPTNAPNYDEATRLSWDPAAATVSSISSTNAATVDFTMSAGGTVKGIFLVSVNTKDDHTGGANNVLWATGLFPGGDQVVVASDSLKITYTVNASAA